MNQCRSSKVRARVEISDGTKKINDFKNQSTLLIVTDSLFSHRSNPPPPPKEILPQEVSAGPAPCQTGGDLGGAVVGGADGLHHRGRHPGEGRGEEEPVLPKCVDLSVKKCCVLLMFSLFLQICSPAEKKSIDKMIDSGPQLAGSMEYNVVLSESYPNC